MSRDGYANVQLLGNLTRDPELRYTPKGSAVASFALAVNRTIGTGDAAQSKVEYYDVQCWGKTAENCPKFLAKGVSVTVHGRLEVQTWLDKQSGQERRKVVVNADRLYSHRPSSPAHDGPPPATPPDRSTQPGIPPDPGAVTGDDNIPF